MGSEPHVAVLAVAYLRTASRLPQKGRRRVAEQVCSSAIPDGQQDHREV
ncbi:MAG: hypothetical protein ACXVUE_24110 [Solirubrobacteraceae bacterium]